MTSAMPEMIDHIVTGSPSISAYELDGTKVMWWRDRIEKWQRGEKFAPVTMDVAWTRKCNAACSFCVEGEQPVRLASGASKPMKEIVEGDQVLSLSAKGEWAISRVVKAWRTNPNANTLQLHMPSSKLVVTGNHPVLTKQGWKRADELQAGEEIAFANADAKPNAQSGIEGESAGDQGEKRLSPTYGRIVQATLGSGENEATFHVPGSLPTSIGTDESGQSSAASRSNGAAGADVAREASAIFRTHEGILENRKDRAETDGADSEQVGSQDFLGTGTDGVSLYRRWNALDRQYTEWHTAQSGLHSRQREEQKGVSIERRLFSPGYASSGSGVEGLPIDRLDGVDFLGEKSRLKLASADDSGSSEGMVGWSRLIAIEPGPDSAVYDLECHPHHNFVAGGFVVHNCYAMTQASDGGTITKKQAFQFLEDAAEIGVKGISLISDGESTVVPWYEESIEHAAKCGLKVGVGTNGVRLKKAVLERILPHLSYLRFNFSAGELDRYKEIMGLKERDYHQVIQNVKDAMAIKRRDNLNLTINCQMVTMPEFHDQIVPLAKLCRDELRPDYLIYKHTADTVEGILGVDYRLYDKCYTAFHEVEGMGDEQFRVVVKWARLADEGKRDYQKCFGPPFILQMSGNGLIAPCGFMFNTKFAKHHIGWIADREGPGGVIIPGQRFRDIWASDRYWDVVNYLGSDQFNAQKSCGPNCLQTLANSWLDKMDKGLVGLPSPGIAPPPHMEFI